MEMLILELTERLFFYVFEREGEDEEEEETEFSPVASLKPIKSFFNK